jgi:hypothetical protein
MREALPRAMPAVQTGNRVVPSRNLGQAMMSRMSCRARFVRFYGFLYVAAKLFDNECSMCVCARALLCVRREREMFVFEIGTK